MLGEREVGEIRVRGESVTPGYLTVDGPLATQDADGWLDTGDEGYLVDGQIVVCGRRKDVIIMGGRNIYPTDIERAASAVDGVRAGNAVAVRLDAGTRRERFAVVVESKLAGDEDAVRAAQGDRHPGRRRRGRAAVRRGRAAAGNTAQDPVGQATPLRGRRAGLRALTRNATVARTMRMMLGSRSLRAVRARRGQAAG